MDLDQLLKAKRGEKETADARREADAAREMEDFRAYVEAFKDRISETLVNVKGVGPMSWDKFNVRPESGSSDLRAEVRGRTDADGHRLILSVSTKLEWRTLSTGSRKCGRPRETTVEVRSDDDPSKKGVGYHHVSVAAPHEEDVFILPGELLEAVTQAVDALARA
jgi:hypothetical protein